MKDVKNLIFDILPLTNDQNSVAREDDIRNKQILILDILYQAFGRLDAPGLVAYMKSLNAQLKNILRDF